MDIRRFSGDHIRGDFGRIDESIHLVFMWLSHTDNVEVIRYMRNDMIVLINTMVDGENCTIWLLVAAILPCVEIYRFNNMPKVSALLAFCEGYPPIDH